VVFETESALSGPIRVVDQGDERRLVAREEVGRDDPRASEVLQVDQKRRQAS